MLPHQSPNLLIIIFIITISICNIKPPIVTAQNGAPNTREDNNDPASESPPYTGIIFIIFSGAVIVLSFIIYYIRERCYFRRRSNLQHNGQQLPTWQGSTQTSQPKGVDPTLLQTFPVFKHSQAAAALTIIIPDDDDDNEHQAREGGNNPQQECAVCLMTFEEKDELRLLPKCDHVFHKDCVDAWLIDHTTCPFCRADLLSQESAIDGKQPIKGGGSRPAGKEASATLTGQRDVQVVISTGEDGPSRSGLNREEEEVNRPRPSQP